MHLAPDYDIITGLNNTLFAGGRFTSVNTSGTPVERFKACSFDLTTGQVTSWAPNVTGILNQNARVCAIAGNGSQVYLGGDFYGVKCENRKNLVAINANSGTVTGFNPHPNGLVRCIYLDNNNIYIGGDFTTVWGGSANIPRNRIARLDINGTLSTWNPNADGSVTSLAAKGQYIYAGGAFSNMGSNPRPRLSAVKISDGTSSTYTPAPNDTVKSLVVAGDTLFVGGDFTTIASATRNHIASFDITTSMLTSFDPNANGEVLALACKNDELFVGGAFTNISGFNRGRFASFNVKTNAISPIDPISINSDDCKVSALCASDSSVYLSGKFKVLNHGILLNPNSCVVKLNDSKRSRWWHPDPNGLVRSIFLYKDKVYLGGDFTESLNIYQPYFTEVDNFCSVDNYLPEPSDTNFCQGDSIPMAAAFGVGYKYQWYKDNVLLPGATKRYYVPLETGWYKALITDSINYGSLFTNARHVTVYPLASTAVSASGPLNFCGSGGQNVILTAATGSGYAYQWYKNNVYIPNANDYNLTVITSGNHFCVIYNEVGCPVESQHKIVNANILFPQLQVTGTIPKCPSASVILSSNLLTGYFHQWYKNGNKINGETGLSLNVTDAGTYKVRDSIGTCAGFSNDTLVSLLPLPDAAGTITGPATVFKGQTGVSYSVATIVDATGYIWNLPSGATITSGENTANIMVSFSATAISGNMNVQGTNSCGSGVVSPDLYITVTQAVPPERTLTNLIVPNGQTSCYDATQTITVAGNGTVFLVLNGGHATFIAGQKVSFLPGTLVQEGGYAWAYITTTSGYCGSQSAPMVASPVGMEESFMQDNLEHSLFKVYPNPTSGKFTLKITGLDENRTAIIQIFGMMGSLVMKEELTGTARKEIFLENHPDGVYLISVMAGDKMEMKKIVKL